jgi:hypothetical protein
VLTDDSGAGSLELLASAEGAASLEGVPSRVGVLFEDASPEDDSPEDPGEVDDWDEELGDEDDSPALEPSPSELACGACAGGLRGVASLEELLVEPLLAWCELVELFVLAAPE